MADRATIARPYARAAFAYAHDAKDFASWSKLLGGAAEAAADPRVAKLIGHPQVTDEQLVGLFADLAGKEAGEAGRNFLRTLAENKRLALLPEIAAQFDALKAQAENKVKVTMTSATQVDAATAEQVKQALNKRLGREVELELAVDPALIGGAVIRAEDMVIDGSVRGKLEAMAGALVA